MFNQPCPRRGGGIFLKPKLRSTFGNKSWAFLPGDLTYSSSLFFPSFFKIGLTFIIIIFLINFCEVVYSENCTGIF